MKKKFSRIIGVGLTLALLASLVFSVAPVSALTQPSVTPTSTTINFPTNYSLLFSVAADLDEGTDSTIAGGGTLVVGAGKTVLFTAGDTITFTAGDTVIHQGVSIAVAGGGTLVVAALDVVEFTAGDTITFTAGDTVYTDPDSITIEFPTTGGTVITGITGVTIAATSGIGSVAVTTAKAAGYFDVDQELTITVAELSGSDKIGVGAMVQVIIVNVVNPATPGDYTLALSTTDEDAVTSATYTIEAPTIPPAAGVVNVYNDAGILLSSESGDAEIDNAMAVVGAYTIDVGPGTYESAVAVDEEVTIVAVAGAANTTIEGAVTISAKVTLDGFTFDGAVTVIGAGDEATIKNSAFEGAVTLLTINDTADDVTVENSTFDVTGTTTVTGIDANEDVTITGNTFTVDTGGTAINIDATADGGTVEDSTFTGSSGTGITVAGDTTIEGNTFDGLGTALDINGGILSIKGNTITNSTGAAIDIAAVTEVVTIVNNDISDTDEDYYAVHSDAAADKVFVLFNSIVGNALNVDAANALDATHNWWGDADGPASDSYTTAADTSAPLAASVTGAGAAVSASLLDAKTDAGVKVDRTAGTGTAGIIGAARYGANPYTATPLDALADSFFDVYVGAPASTITEITVKLYSGDVTNDTLVYVWSELQGKWVECSSQGASPFGGYAWAKVKTDTTPLIEDLVGIPFVLLESPAAPVIFEIDLTAPQPGSTDVRITNAAFTWTSVADADSYVVSLSANYDLSSPIFREFPTGTAYTYAGTLDYDTPYYWQVLASGAGEPVGESDVGTFTTAVEPVVPPALTYTCPQDGLVFTTPEALIEHWNLYHGPAAPTYTCPVDGLVFTTQDALAAHWNLYHAPAAEVTPAYIWVIIGVGAVLVIGVIVLIVRTRRVT